MEKNSRYFGTEIATRETLDSHAPADDPEEGVRRVRYLRRRLLPDPAQLTTMTMHLVTETDRLDQLAGRYFGDATQFWRIADANPTLRPDDLVENGLAEWLRIASPLGGEG